MTENIFFYLGLSLLTMHEMDAIRCKEWRIFPGLDWISWTIIIGAGFCGLLDLLV